MFGFRDPNATEATEERYDAIDASKMGMRNTSDEYEKPKGITLHVASVALSLCFIRRPLYMYSNCKEYKRYF